MMNKYPKISVVMPVFNRENFLSDAIKSIINQTFTDFEFIIIDDGSTDQSLQIIENFAKQDERIKVVKNNINLGIAKTRNIGIDLSQGEYIAFMDSDDISLPTRFEKQIAYFENSPNIDALGTACAIVDSNGQILSYLRPPLSPIEVRWSIITKSTLINPSMMARRKIFCETGIRHRDLHAADDFDLWSRIADQFQIGNLSEILTHFRMHQGKISVTSHNSQRSEAIEIVRKNIKQLTNIDLTDDQVIGYRNSAHLKNLQDARILAQVTIRLHKVARSWTEMKMEREKINQLAAAKLRAIWKSQNRNIVLLPSVIYSIYISPISLINVLIKNRITISI
jgi:glycosyltransferase involved in cell wall biosynthesis